MGLDASLCVAGIVEPTEEWRKKASAWNACVAAGVRPPDKLIEYFGKEGPTKAGECIEINTTKVECESENVGIDLEITGCYLLIDLATLPKHVTHIKAWIDVSY